MRPPFSLTRLLILGSTIAASTHVVEAGTGIWTSGGPWGSGVSGISSVAVGPVTPSTIYAGMDGGFYKSTDSGGSWWKVANGATAVAVDPTDGTKVYAGRYDGIFRSTDSGATWVRTGTSDFPDVNFLAVALTSPSTLFGLS